MGAGYEAVDRKAYVPRVRPRSVLSGEVVYALVFTGIWMSFPTGGMRFLVLLVTVPVVVGRIRYLSRRASPVVVDAPGIWFGADEDTDDERLVHWEMIAAVVVFHGRAPGSRRLQDGVGVRLRAHPDIVAIRRVPADRKVDRVRLEAAVGRYAPGVPVVDGPGDLADVAAAHNTAEAMITAVREAQRAGTADQPPGWEPGARLVRRERYRPVDPHAYVVRPTWTSQPVVYLFPLVGIGFGVAVARDNPVVGVAVALLGALPAIWHAAGVLRGNARFAVDAPGVFLGEASSGEPDPDHRLVPWDEIATVVRFRVQGDKGRGGPAVGITSVPPGGGEPVIRSYRVQNGWRLERRHLESAVRTFAPQVPVVDGPPLGPGRLSDLARALRTARQQHDDEPPG
jgi:hypothetical protein